MPFIIFTPAMRKFFTDRIVLVSLLVSGTINLFVWLLLYFKIPHSAEPIILHYNIYFSIDLIGSWIKILQIPFIGLIILLINFSLAGWLYGRQKIVAYFLVSTTIMMQIFLLIASICLVAINK